MPTFKSYLTGFIASVLLTLFAYTLITIHINSGHRIFSHSFLLFAIIAIALIQLVVQLIFFLHLHKGADSRWNLVIFFSTVTIILILVIGSIWIMNHLNYNMTPQDMNNYINGQDGI